MRYLLDTCVVSELVKPTPHQEIVRWLQGREEETLFLSVLTFGELQKGISKLPPGPRQETLREWVSADLVLRFSGRTLDIDTDVAVAWGEMQGEAEGRGQRLPVMDSLIAATALVHNLTVVTRNTKDIERCGAGAFNPWESG